MRGEDNDPFRSFLRSLPDEIARAAERGQPIVYRCDAEPPEHVRRLMATLGVPIVTLDDPLGIQGARSMGNFTPTDEPGGNGHREPDWIDYRASVARAARRLDAGENVTRCASCGTELDVAVIAHSPRCSDPRPAPDPAPDPAPGPVLEPEPDPEPARDPVAEVLRLLQASALELADLGATDPAIARHFANVCAHALTLRAGEASA